jgi:hypothetical protein
MARVGFSSYQGAFSNIFENIKVKTKACVHSNTNLEKIISSKMKPLDSFKPLAKKKPMRFYEKTHVFWIHGLVIFHGQNPSFGMVAWFFKFNTLSVIRF